MTLSEFIKWLQKHEAEHGSRTVSYIDCYEPNETELNLGHDENESIFILN